jgi:hypothetical protein
MDDLCLSIRTLRKHYEKTKDVELWDDDFPLQLVETELSVINELSTILEEELKLGQSSDRGRNLARATSDVFGLTPISRGDHFLFGILDLVQQHAQTIESVKVSNRIVKVALKVAYESRYSFLRCKAFEVLAVMSMKRDFSPDQEIRDTLSKDWPVDMQDKAEWQWTVIKRRTEDLERKVKRLRGEAPKPDAVLFKNPTTQAPLTQAPTIQVHLQDILIN